MNFVQVAIKMGASVEAANALSAACTRFNISTPNQMSHFLGQIHVESAGFKVLRENLNYSTSGLLKTFSRARISLQDAIAFGRSDARQANQSAIANIIYGGVWGANNLGNTKPGDGWAFIGRGFKQLTGRSNYTMYSKGVYGDDRIVQNSKLLEQLPDAALSAGWFWNSRKLNPLADANDYSGLTRKVNGGQNGLDQRVAATKKARAFFDQ